MAYTPNRGDVVWLTLDPRVGHEQSGRRPTLVLTEIAYNRRAGLALVCPITNQVKGYPFEVALPAGLPVSGVVLADQVRSVDVSARREKLICRLPQATLDDVLRKLRLLL